MLASTVLVTSVLAALVTPPAGATPFRYGHAAYAYGPLHCASSDCAVVPSCNKAHWSSQIDDYNNEASPGSEINIVYSYGGDIEFWAGKANPDGCYAPASMNESVCNVSIYYDMNNQYAAHVYKGGAKVESVVALVDSRMDGWEQIATYNDFDGCKFGNFYPDLRNLSDAGLVKLANDTARLYCNCETCDDLDGLQVDLEPYRDPYKTNLNKYVAAVANNLRDETGEFGCKNDKHPEGKTVSYFTFAHDQSLDFTENVLGKNGYYVFSGYDLDPKPEDGGFMYNSPDEFEDRLRKEITYFRPVLGKNGHFTIGLPIGASCHEYEQYVPMKGKGCGPACEPLTNNATMLDYVKKWMDVLTDPAVTKATNGLFCLREGSQFLGTSLWSFSYQMTYPPMKWFDNEFLPGTPPTPAMDYLKTNLNRLRTESCTKSQLNGDFSVHDDWLLPGPDPFGVKQAVSLQQECSQTMAKLCPGLKGKGAACFDCIHKHTSVLKPLCKGTGSGKAYCSVPVK